MGSREHWFFRLNESRVILVDEMVPSLEVPAALPLYLTHYVLFILPPPPYSVLANRQSHVHMDHYVFPTGNAAADMELGRPGKGSRPVPGARQRGLFAVVQQTG